MILGIGTDLVDSNRIKNSLEKFGEKFENRLFTEAEQALANEQGDRKHMRYAKYMAAKEACYKALGDNRTHGIGWHDFEIGYEASGKPFIDVRGNALTLLQGYLDGEQKTEIHLSLSDEPPYASAYVVIEVRDPISGSWGRD